MALDKVEQKIVEQYFDMRTGYVLHHSNRTFADFFEQFDIDIYNDRYCDIGDSKAKRLRSFFNQHDDEIIGKVILALIEDNDIEQNLNSPPKNHELRQRCIDIANRLINSATTVAPTQHNPLVNPFKSQLQQVRAAAINEVFGSMPNKPLQEAPSWDQLKPQHSQTESSMTKFSVPEKEKIFIVHGHDEHLLSETENLLRKLNLDPIVLRDQHSGGKTIIEKLEKYGDVRYAVILYTACDEGRKIGTPEVNPRARQNVVFEHGYFIGRLGRENVAAVVKGNVEIQGDISGVVYHKYQTGWQYELAKEMKRSGLNVDLNHL
ncbi:nucleotide-binding protein [Aeromonas veronii]|uniref:TIR domain-containing protein n=1 Tax=Aeromonas veronii TaxID=654 RepID=UPI000C281CC2|nr:nucleotide-binding protein [Aeromonas veronii]ATY81804.1 nucleotide-binding protein [Aeromonas veronii]